MVNGVKSLVLSPSIQDQRETDYYISSIESGKQLHNRRKKPDQPGPVDGKDQGRNRQRAMNFTYETRLEQAADTAKNAEDCRSMASDTKRDFKITVRVFAPKIKHRAWKKAEIRQNE